MIDARQRALFRLLWTDGRLSRSEIHERSRLTPNGVGMAAEALLRDGLVRECPSSGVGAGRPRVPLEIDPTRRHMIGLVLQRGRVAICRLGLSGNIIDRHESEAALPFDRLVPAAVELLSTFRDERTVGVGVSVAGFVDPDARVLLINDAAAGCLELDLSPIYIAAGLVPLVVENDMHALAARWLLTHRADSRQDVLLAYVEDGHMGAAMLIDGRPNRGCATGANDLGHMRTPVATEQCFCGQTGCLERIVSTTFLHRLDRSGWHDKRSVDAAGESTELSARVARFVPDGSDTSLDQLINHLAGGLANVVNFVRPHRLVLVSSFLRHARFAEQLNRVTRQLVLPQLMTRVTFDAWDQPVADSAEMAAWLPMAELLCGGWKNLGRPSQISPIDTPLRQQLS